ncbi:hypothetical protein [Candidatus Nitrotoga sp. M5]|uniref:hypothetical protein n=1 Tax=Candidatus Nitrotoga sp. M5 TaxID=2890409 RepID=UPI001EF1E4CE|nr:hypothetical protein [Candidatus Nitrotoga sp. M5]CAH1385687.1 conserved exported hypothetical protein [Candidatus Nitrotoga sp. M5]
MKKSLINITIMSCFALGATLAHAGNMTGITASGIYTNTGVSYGPSGGRGNQLAGADGRVQPSGTAFEIQTQPPAHYHYKHVSNQTNIVQSGPNGPFNQLGNPGMYQQEYYPMGR